MALLTGNKMEYYSPRLLLNICDRSVLTETFTPDSYSMACVKLLTEFCPIFNGQESTLQMTLIGILVW